MAGHRKVLFPSETEEYGGFQVLFDKGPPISYFGERRYVVSEDDCQVLRKEGVNYQVLDAQNCQTRWTSPLQ